MKRRDLIKRLEEMVVYLSGTAPKHDFYTNFKTNQSQPIPRHNEIKESLAKSIIKKLSDK